ncbi:MAG TPA: efflux RND transporter periplasmic adaptor subunit [Ignavibacteria bacterium]|nr:efflux RND transporter periplasmic adaptor subunit [Ignavibacteria bacterium]
MSEANTPVQPIVPPAKVTVNKKKKKGKKKLLWILGLLLLVIIVIAAIISSKKEELITVQTEKIIPRNITQLVTATGKIQSEIEVNISSEISGEIISLPFKEGEEVKKNDLVVKIKQDAYSPQIQEQNASIAVAESNLKLSEVTLRKFKLELDRIKELNSKGLASQSDLDNAQINYDQTLAQINTNTAQINQQRTGMSRINYDISKTTIYSPINGTVTQLNNETGEKVLGTVSNQGSNILTISDLSKMECQVEVGETDVAFVRLGDTAKIEIDAYPDKVFNGYVYEIANTASSTGQGTQDEVVNFIVKIRILNNDVDLRPGMSCTVDIEVEKKMNVLSVPIQSVTTRDETMNNKLLTGESDEKEEENENLKRESEEKMMKRIKPKEVVFIIDNSTSKKVEVKTGISDDSYIEIVEGLNEGQEVVKGTFKAINKELEDGSKVEIDNEIKKRKMKSKDDE